MTEKCNCILLSPGAIYQMMLHAGQVFRRLVELPMSSFYFHTCSGLVQRPGDEVGEGRGACEEAGRSSGGASTTLVSSNKNIKEEEGDLFAINR